MDSPPSPQPPDARHLSPELFDRWYGAWDPLTPATIDAFMAGFDRPWWIVGGWSIEVFSGCPARPRGHGHLDVLR